MVTDEETTLFEQLIREGEGLDLRVMNEAEHPRLVQGLLSLAIVGSMLYGAGVGIAAQFFGHDADLGLREWLGAVPVFSLPVALTAAFLVALMVSLPSFYFYTQLSGLDASVRLVTVQALRVQARTSVLMLGALPIYAAVALAAILGAFDDPEDVIYVGLYLPFVLGLLGLGALYRSFKRLSAELPVAHRRRPSFVPRLVLAWGAIYAVICPIALYNLGGFLGGLF